MRSGRRLLAAVLLAMLLAPTLGMLVAPYETRSVLERRMLRPPPAAAPDRGGWLALPRALDGWFADHFAWRGRLLQADLWLKARAGLRRGGDLVVVKGRGDWLLLQQGLLGSTGGEVDPGRARRYAGFVCDLAATARARGAGFLFVPAPNTAEIYPEAVPEWVSRGPVSQRRLTLQATAAGCGAPALDLGPAMLAAKGPHGLYQRHDSHWTNAGALVAYDGMARALGRPEWAIRPEDLHWRPGKPIDSDLVRLSGALDLAQELTPQPPEGPEREPETGRMPELAVRPYEAPFVVPGRPGAPTVLIVGDSYAAGYLGQYFRRSGVTFAWVHHAQCRFDRRVLDRVRPDYVVLMPAARLLFCR